MKAVHELGDAVSVRVGEVEVARYVNRLESEPFEAPKPYLHPLRTLAGDIVTGYRPHDHRWHKGLQLTATDVSGHNLWGGHTYVDGRVTPRWTTSARCARPVRSTSRPATTG